MQCKYWRVSANYCLPPKGAGILLTVRVVEIFCAGLSHKTTPVSVRERYAVRTQDLPEALAEIRSIKGFKETVVLSTCNRVEFYAAATSPPSARRGLERWLETRGGGRAALYHHDNTSAARHLFRVSSGLDSMVPGETEVFGQVKRAYAAAAAAGATARHLNKLFQEAFRVAKSVRASSHLTRGPSSVGAVAVELATRIFGDLSTRRILILGAGETSEGTARSLHARGVESVIVASRTFERGARLAREVSGKVIHFDHWHSEFAAADIIISATAAPHPILTAPRIGPLISDRRGRPLFVIDLAVPRDATPEVAALPGVHVHDIDSLRGIAEESLRARAAEALRCEAMIEREAGRFAAWMSGAARTSRHPA